MDKNIEEKLTFLDHCASKIKDIIKGYTFVLQEDENAIYKSILLFHTCKMISIAESASALIHSGKFNEIDILLRSFLECYINIAFIRRNGNFYALLFALDETNRTIQKKQSILKQFGDNKQRELEQAIENHEKETLDIIKLINSKFPDFKGNLKKFIWAYKYSIKKRAKAVDLEYEYEYLFSSLSESVHSSSKSLLDYVSLGDRYIVPKMDENDDGLMIERIIFLIEYLLKIFKVILDDFEIKKIEEIKKLSQQFNKLKPGLNNKEKSH
jgi:hypothetical protein